ncbi:membrane protein FxsA [Mesorhizobium sp. YIM 152430]|uniref:FxsA family protein n=1 Tax=Mesorhizobium sp. YIM 152430 TaxID=3031761 RepID=UPI0023DB8FDD|nr:FxsA family protein [Mesorhizobium sp. YIM 152430]MDF1600744.1 membrane protein FxsA [Mesorhizobium sp. YIM 152430]
MRFPLIPLIILALPLVEIATFIAIGSQIGVLATLGLIFASAFLGIILVRVQGFNTIQRIRTELHRGGSPGRDLVHGLMIVVAGILLIIPGFVTDAVGLLLFLPPVRDLGWRFLRERIRVTTVQTDAAWQARRHAHDGVVDLDADDYRDLSQDGEPQTHSPSDPRLPPR